MTALSVMGFYTFSLLRNRSRFIRQTFVLVGELGQCSSGPRVEFLSCDYL